MPFGITNASATFDMLMNDKLHPYIGRFVVHLIVERVDHLREVVTALRKAILYANKMKLIYV